MVDTLPQHNLSQQILMATNNQDMVNSQVATNNQDMVNSQAATSNQDMGSNQAATSNQVGISSKADISRDPMELLQEPRVL